jgi:hypothetical protein
MEEDPVNTYIRITVYPYVLEQFSTSPRRDRRRHCATGGDDDERCEGGNENSTAAEAAVVAVDTVKRPSGSITRAYVRERRRTREECFFMMCAREKSSETGESDEKDDG